MQGIQRILVIVDTRKARHVAFNRAIQLAKATRSSLHLLAPNPKPDTASAELLGHLSQEARSQGIDVTSQELWRNNLLETIIHVRQMERSHLVVKDFRQESFLEKPFSTPTDWALLRKSRVPVLLVRHDRPWEKELMLAAINADPDDADHQQLNLAIMENAKSVTGYFDAELHLASAYPTIMLAMQDKGDGMTDKDRYLQNCQHFAKDYGVAESAIHLVPAPAETMIPDLTRELAASLLIMGTNARSGLSALTLGNTAEQLASNIDCDLLAVQSKHHMLPLERELEA
ncbi:universal stress protein [Endozoicomonas arenosclerae]|uniref:universal stress protein n=1 Tax=Endozoicomonas arenosclerae TaxID=1633495 RepID=UPI000782E950|nr:universal stress protein [Endozoicomonas arenosclerae]